MLINWNNDKNKQLIETRWISFEEVLQAMNDNKILDTIVHYNENKYPNQRILIININNYAYLVPFVRNNKEIFLKTIIPSRKATKQYFN